MRAQRNTIHPASHRASPARRNPPALDPRHPTSHHAGPDDTAKTTPPGGSALGGPVRRQGLVRLPPGAGLSGEGLTARPSRPNDSPRGGAQADGATDTTADDHPAVNTPPRTRPTATPSPGPALTSPARRAYCVISAIRFAYGWRADGGPAGARVGLRALALCPALSHRRRRILLGCRLGRRLEAETSSSCNERYGGKDRHPRGGGPDGGRLLAGDPGPRRQGPIHGVVC